MKNSSANRPRPSTSSSKKNEYDDEDEHEEFSSVLAFGQDLQHLGKHPCIKSDVLVVIRQAQPHGLVHSRSDQRLSG